MQGTLSENLSRCARQLNQFAGQPGVYRRGSLAVDLKAIPSTPDFGSENPDGTVETWRGVMLVVPWDEWLHTGLGTPQKGDRYETTVPATGERIVYAVLAPKGMQEWDRPGQGESIRIHAKQYQQ